MNRPDWSEFWSLRLSNQKEIINYIDWLEKEVKSLSHELEKSECRIKDYQLRVNTHAYESLQELKK